jgi:hypothetical protein
MNSLPRRMAMGIADSTANTPIASVVFGLRRAT